MPPPAQELTEKNAAVEMARTGRISGPPVTSVRTENGRTELTTTTPDGAVTRVRSGGGRPQEVEFNRSVTWSNMFGNGSGR